MSNKNEVFEYLIDQLRRQVNRKDVTSFNVSVRVSDLDEVKQVIHNLQQHIAGKDDEIRALKGGLRQQVAHNPYKQQCEDLAHEVLSLKNQLRDASAQIKELHMALVKATGDVEAYKLARKGGYIDGGQRYVVGEHGPEQSGCRKEDVQVEKSWVEHDGAAAHPVPADTVVDIKFRNGEVESNTKASGWSWSWGVIGGPYEIVAYRVVKPGCSHPEGRVDTNIGFCSKCGNHL